MDNPQWKLHQSSIYLEVIQTPGNMKSTQWFNNHFSSFHNLQVVISSKTPIHASESMQSRLWNMKERIPFLNIHPLRETSASIGCHVDFVQTYSASWTKFIKGSRLLKNSGHPEGELCRFAGTEKHTAGQLFKGRTASVDWWRSSYLTIMGEWRPLCHRVISTLTMLQAILCNLEQNLLNKSFI